MDTNILHAELLSDSTHLCHLLLKHFLACYVYNSHHSAPPLLPLPLTCLPSLDPERGSWPFCSESLAKLAGAWGTMNLRQTLLPGDSQKLGTASEDTAFFWPWHHQSKQRRLLLGRRQLFPFSKHSLPTPVFSLGSQRLVEKTMPS